MSQLKIIVYFMVILAGYAGYKKFRAHQVAAAVKASVPTIAAGRAGPAEEPFTKISGGPIELKDVAGLPVKIPSQEKPQLIVFWGPNCGYSRRSMGILQRFEREYGKAQIEALGLYPNVIDDPNLIASQKTHGYQDVRVVAAQRELTTMQKIVETFQIRGTGSDLYVVSRSGTVYRIEAREAHSTTIEMTVRGTLEKVLKEI